MPHFRRLGREHRVTMSTRLTLVSVGAFVLAAVCASLPVAAQTPKTPDTVVLANAPNGAVTFNHKVHAKEVGAKCTTCHHPSKPEKALKGENQKCADCHTKVAAAPMKTKRQAAFHDPMAKKGTCVDCHAQAAAKGKKTPAKCADCHKKA